jgi:hypothetical protein
LNSLKSIKVINANRENIPECTGDEDTSSFQMIKISNEELKQILTSASGIGDKKYNKMNEEFRSTEDVVVYLNKHHLSLQILKVLQKINKTNRIGMD